MYEPVTDTHVTILKPNFAIQNCYEQQSDIDIEDLSKTDVSEENHEEQPVASQEELIQPPEKPPRRNKLKKLEDFKMRQNNVDNFIDIDHINLESERNYKNRFLTVSVQTSPIVPYRLRLLPKMCSIDEKYSENKLKCCCRVISQLFLSQVGLTITLISWALLGAAGFYNTEGNINSTNVS